MPYFNNTLTFNVIFILLLVEPVPKTGCVRNVPLRVNSEEGYISSLAMSGVRKESTQCSWVISATIGQRINITLLDFSTPIGRRQDSGICLVYAIIKEHKDTSEITVCRGTQRLRNVYISEGNVVEIQVYTDPTIAREGVFLLKYQGNKQRHIKVMSFYVYIKQIHSNSYNDLVCWRMQKTTPWIDLRHMIVE